MSQADQLRAADEEVAALVSGGVSEPEKDPGQINEESSKTILEPIADNPNAFEHKAADKSEDQTISESPLAKHSNLDTPSPLPSPAEVIHENVPITTPSPLPPSPMPVDSTVDDVTPQKTEGATEDRSVYVGSVAAPRRPQSAMQTRDRALGGKPPVRQRPQSAASDPLRSRAAPWSAPPRPARRPATATSNRSNSHRARPQSAQTWAGGDSTTTLFKKYAYGAQSSPGPGDYQMPSCFDIRTPGFRMGSSKRPMPGGKGEVPGPGAYTVTSRSDSIRGGGFGKSQRPTSGPLRNYYTPGPGSYDLKSTFSKRGFHFSKEQQRVGRDPMCPGPIYSVSKNAVLEKAPSWGFPKERREYLKKQLFESPGPIYNTSQSTNTVMTRSPNFAFGMQLKPPGDKKKTPGPGQYTLKSDFEESTTSKKNSFSFHHGYSRGEVFGDNSEARRNQCIEKEYKYLATHFVEFRPQ
eukprot:Rmarinus@m.6504